VGEKGFKPGMPLDAIRWSWSGSAGDDMLSHSRVLNAGEELKIGSENGDDWVLNIANVNWDVLGEKLVYRSKLESVMVVSWRTSKDAATNCGAQRLDP
jgi:hypothetical protein